MNERTAVARREVKLLLGDRRQDAAFHADHGADERIDDDEQRELREVLAKAQTDAGTAAARRRSCPTSRRSCRSRHAAPGAPVGDALLHAVGPEALLRRSFTASTAKTQ